MGRRPNFSLTQIQGLVTIRGDEEWEWDGRETSETCSEDTKTQHVFLSVKKLMFQIWRVRFCSIYACF